MLVSVTARRGGVEEGAAPGDEGLAGVGRKRLLMMLLLVSGPVVCCVWCVGVFRCASQCLVIIEHMDVSDQSCPH
jgi:hypothetical protein